VLVLDEPTISIDPIGVAELLELIRGLVKEHGLTVLLSSHLLEQVQHICDRVGIFCAGRLMAHGTVSELMGSSADGMVTVEVGVEGDRSIAVDAARGLPGVSEVVPDEEQPGVLLVRSAHDVRNELVAELTRRGLPITHLLRRQAGLEAVYRRYIEQCQERFGRGLEQAA
jgi:ABC-2 type transport system ATP-binding protein